MARPDPTTACRDPQEAFQDIIKSSRELNTSPLKGVPGRLVGDGSSVPDATRDAFTHPRRQPVRLLYISEWRRDALRTTLWLVPVALVVAACATFAVTYLLDRTVFEHGSRLPFWHGDADAARLVLTSIAAAVITVTGVVFSVVIVALTLASQQFGPRMLRNFIRDLGTQLTLGVFVATFVYSILTLGSISSAGNPDFVPHLSITVALILLLTDLGVLIYFIHHVAVSIQLNEVVASIGRDLARAMDEWMTPRQGEILEGDARDVIGHDLGEGAVVLATRTGYLQAISHARLVDVASEFDAVIILLHRPGHFLVDGGPLARVYPASAARAIRQSFERSHITGPHRTLTQDPVFAIDQLVEIAIRALSPAVNDTFTAITCIDWLTAGLCRLSGLTYRARLFRDGSHKVRVIEAPLTYDRLVDGAFDKIRQAGRGMPAIAIRQLDSLVQIAQFVSTDEERRALLRQAEMILRASDEAIDELLDREDVRRRYGRMVDATAEAVRAAGANAS